MSFSNKCGHSVRRSAKHADVRAELAIDPVDFRLSPTRLDILESGILLVSRLPEVNASHSVVVKELGR